jgi:hypothetical protein
MRIQEALSGESGSINVKYFETAHLKILWSAVQVREGTKKTGFGDFAKPRFLSEARKSAVRQTQIPAQQIINLLETYA